MKITLLYIRVITRAEPSLPMHFPYEDGHRRWLATYRAFRPSIPHEVLIVNCGKHEQFDPWFDEVATRYAYYDGLGSDCGTYQFIGKTLECDLCIVFNTITYFWRDGWLEPFVAAFEKHGPGVYGASASYERFPHLRMPCIGFAPKIMREYPHLVDTRQKAVEFEAGRENFSLWAMDHGYPTLLVAADGVYSLPQWRTPPNIFRRGDQTNMVVWDRHTQIYETASPEEKSQLAAAADAIGR